MTRLLAYSLIAFIALTPVVWIRPMGNFLALFHIAGMVMTGLACLQPGAYKAFALVADRGKWIWWPSLALLAVMCLMLVKRHPPYAPMDIAKHAAYLALAFGSAGATYILWRERALHLLSWTPLVSIVVLFAFMQYAMLGTGVSLWSAIAFTIETGDPNRLIFGLFKTLFASDLEEARANMRHGMGQGLLCAVLAGILGALYAPRQRVVWIGGALAVGMIALTFSRSTWLAAILALGLFSLQFFSSGKRLYIGFNILLACGAVFAMLPIGRVFLTRLESLGSYQGRLSASADRWQAAGQNMWFGSDYPVLFKAHNLLIDHWASAGILGGVAAFFLLCAVATMALQSALRSGTSPHPKRRIAWAVAAGMLLMVLVRYFTAPDGLPQIGTWIAMGMAVGILACLMQAVRSPQNKWVKTQ
jgi:hypothetical protein